MIQMKTKSGVDFYFVPKEMIDCFDGYDKAVAECHIANCGKIIVDGYGLPIDNEYDLDEIYTILEERI